MRKKRAGKAEGRGPARSRALPLMPRAREAAPRQAPEERGPAGARAKGGPGGPPTRAQPPPQVCAWRAAPAGPC